MKQSFKYIGNFIAVFLFVSGLSAQKSQMITLVKEENNNRINVLIGDKPFTSFIYPDSLEKPVLYPIYASNDELITRGFPIAPRPNEPTDHPHHIGLWLNYESVNGLDFWNNSSAIAAADKPHYGWIKTTKILETKSGVKGSLKYSANWQDIKNNILLQEITTYNFSSYNNLRIIDRTTTLTAQQDVAMPDVKDGFLGLRVAHELELPSKEEREFTDNKGNLTKVKAANDASVSGNYITSEGFTGDSAWSTRAKWCMLYGKKGNDTI
ncbi:MAG: PmoA family protein, partial [Bacteroidota bacterium]